MGRLPISIGILAWHSGQTLVDTLESYHKNALFDIVPEVSILFQETTEEDELIANHFDLPYTVSKNNIGIGKAFIKMTRSCLFENVLILEHDWQLIEDKETMYKRLKSGIDMLESGYDCIRYRHRKNPGFPHFSFRNKGNELNYYDDEIEATSPHLLDSLHWLEPDLEFPDKINKEGEYFTTTSRWANFTNNPCMYKRSFYLNSVEPFVGEGIDLEGKISKWWNRQNFKVAHGEGLFCHVDKIKYGR